MPDHLDQRIDLVGLAEERLDARVAQRAATVGADGSAVTITIGMSRVAGSARSRRATSSPSMSGRWRPSRMRSGRSVRAASRADKPSATRIGVAAVR